MKKCLAIAVLLLASSHRRAGPVHLRIWRPHHHHRSRSRNGSDPRRLRQYRQEGQAPAQRGGDLDRPRQKAPQQAKSAPQAAPEPAASGRTSAGRTGCRASCAAPHLPAAAPPPATDAFDRDRSTATAAVAPADATGATRPACCKPLRPRRTGAGSRCRAGSPPLRRNRNRPPRRQLRRSVRELAARRLADGGEGRQGADRTMRRQSLRLFRRQEVEPERRAGSDQHEARQGQMERPDSRSEQRQHL